MTPPYPLRYTSSCINGHPWPEFCYVKPDGDRFCRGCANDRRRAANKSKKVLSLGIPRIDPKTSKPSAYDKCKCGMTKARVSKVCRECWKRGENLIAQPDDTSIRFIALNKGKVAIVDAADYEQLVQRRWSSKYDKTTGCFYAQRSIVVNGKAIRIWMHREILGLSHGDPRIGDHIRTKDTLNNTRSNLRITDKYGNGQNSPKKVTNTTGFKGVTKNHLGFIARICVHRERIYLGHRSTAEAAGELYRLGAEKYHKEFARTELEEPQFLAACGVPKVYRDGTRPE